VIPLLDLVLLSLFRKIDFITPITSTKGFADWKRSCTDSVSICLTFIRAVPWLFAGGTSAFHDNCKFSEE
jgi:hypothetical protein